MKRLTAAFAAAVLIATSCSGPPDGAGGDEAGPGGAGAVPQVDSQVEQLRHDPTILEASIAVGAIGGDSSVDDSGRSHYDIPIDVAPGPAGMQPSVSLSYSSSGGNGLVGMGFSLSGFPELTRCPRTIAEDGLHEPIEWDSDDALCLAGQRLVLSSGIHGSPGSEYRLRSDPTRKVTLAGGFIEGGSIGTFTVWDKSGWKHDFEPLTEPDGAPNRWVLSHTEDRFDNAIDYTWTTFQHAGPTASIAVEAVPSSIAYGGTGSNNSRRQVRFDYDVRPDAREGFYFGRYWRRTRRLAGITVEGPQDQVLRTYGLTYSQHALAGQSILTSAQLCDAAGQCLPATTFAWHGDDAVDPAVGGAESVFYDDPVGGGALPPHIDDNIKEGQRLTVGDFDGDGRDEALTYHPDSAEQWQVSNLEATTRVLHTAPAELLADDNILPGGWQAISEGIEDGETDVPNLFRIQRAPGVSTINFNNGDTHEVLVPTTADLFQADDFDAHGVSFVDRLWVAFPTTDWDAPESSPAHTGHLDFVYYDVDRPNNVYVVVPLDFNGDDRTDLFVCEGEGFKNSFWQLGLNVGEPGGQHTWEFHDTQIGCSTHDELNVLQVNGLQRLAVVPRFETDPALMVFPDPDDHGAYLGGITALAESARPTHYQLIDFDPDSGLPGELTPSSVPRDLFQRWHDLRCNNSYVDTALSAPLLGVGQSHDKHVDLDGDGNTDILRFELLEGDTTTQLSAIKQTLIPDGQWHTSVSCDYAPQDAIIRAYRNTGTEYVAIPTPFHMFFGSAHANFWLNFQSGMQTDWNQDGSVDLVLPSSGVSGDWTLLLSDSDGTATAASFAPTAGVPEPWPRYSNGLTWMQDFEDLERTKLFSYSDRIPDDGITFVMIRGGSGYAFQLADFHPTNATFPAVLLASATDGLGLTHAFAYSMTPDGVMVTTKRRLNVPDQCDSPTCEFGHFANDCEDASLCPDGTWTFGGFFDGAPPMGLMTQYEYGGRRVAYDGRGFLGFQWVREITQGGDGTFASVRRFQTRRYDYSYDPTVRSYPRSGRPALIESAWVSDFEGPDEVWHVSCETVDAWDLSTETLAGGTTWHSYPSAGSSHSRLADPSDYSNVSPARHNGPREQCSGFTSIELTTEASFTTTRDSYGNTLTQQTTSNVGILDESTTITYADYIIDPATWFVRAPQTATTENCIDGTCETRSTSVAYDVASQTVQGVTREPGDPQLFQHLDLTYDGHGNVDSSTLTTVDGSRATSVEWDAEGVTPLSATNALSQVSQFVADPASGVPSAIVDPNGITTKFQYDGFYRPIGSSHHSSPAGPSDGADVTIEYGFLLGGSEPMQVTTSSGGQTLYEIIDRAGRVRKSSWSRPGDAATFPVAAVLTGPAVCSWSSYDVWGNVLRQSLPTSSCAAEPPLDMQRRFEYDGAHRAIRTTWDESGGQPQELIEHTDVRATRYTSIVPFPQVDGVETRLTDADGNTSSVFRGGSGQVLATQDAAGTLTCFEYGPFGRVEGVHRNCEYDASGPVESSTYTHDAVGRVLSSTEPASGTAVRTYTGFDEIDTITDAKGQLTQFGYDTLGRLTSRTTAGGTASWDYDNTLVGALGLTWSEDDVRHSYSYDEFGRVSSVTSATPEMPSGGFTGPWYEFSLEYDGQGRLSRLHYPEVSPGVGVTVAYGYDGHGYLRSIAQEQSGVLTNVLWGLNSADEAGQPTQETFNQNDPHSRLTDYYPRTFRVEEIDVVAGSQSLETLRYSWTPGGDLVSREDNVNVQTETFQYDALHRLRRSTIGAAQTEVQYDALGRIAWKQDVGTYNYDGVTGWLDSFGAPATALAHDPNGNVVGYGSQIVTWTPLDMARTIDDGATHLEFHYDVDGQRTWRVHNGDQDTTTLFGLFELYDGSGGETDPDVAKYRVYGPGGVVAELRKVKPRATWLDDGTYFQQSDHLGSGSVVLDDASDVQASFAYDPWGNARDWTDWTQPTATDPSELGAGFTGHQPELDGGFINMRGRMYAPEIGQFLSVDPLVANPASAQSWNSYSYVLNNPLRFTDPTGLAPSQPNDDKWVCWGKDKHGNETCQRRPGGGTTPTEPDPLQDWATGGDPTPGSAGRFSSSGSVTGGPYYTGAGGGVDQGGNRQFKVFRNPTFDRAGSGSQQDSTDVDPADAACANDIGLQKDLCRSMRSVLPRDNPRGPRTAENMKEDILTGEDYTMAGDYAVEVAVTIVFSAVPVGRVVPAVSRVPGMSRVASFFGRFGRFGARNSSKILRRTAQQLQKKFKHAADFGVTGNYSKANAARFSAAIHQHINKPGVRTIAGTFRKNPVTHHVDPKTGLNVIEGPAGDFVSGWKLNPTQLENVLKHGGL